jgi:putative hydrolase of HD superfamily
MTFAPREVSPALDVAKCVQMAIVHDLAESLVGDIAPDQGVSKEEKYELERNAFDQLRGKVPDFGCGMDMESLWNEYEERVTPESHFVKQCDLLEMIIQAEQYEERNGGAEANFLQEFFDSVPESAITFSSLRQLYHEIIAKRQKRVSPA